VTNGAGNYAAFLHRYFVYKSHPTQLAPISGSMGYGLPAAIAAKLEFPDRVVVALAGDGCFQMTGPELATAAQLGLPVIVIIADNASLGTIRMHQERRYPGRITATTLMNPDFAALARSHGAWSTTVTSEDGFSSALETALSVDRAAVIVLRLDIEDLTPMETLTDIRMKK
jgi:acetolactate synthase-1/2/3 large subunit